MLRLFSNAGETGSQYNDPGLTTTIWVSPQPKTCENHVFGHLLSRVGTKHNQPCVCPSCPSCFVSVRASCIRCFAASLDMASPTAGNLPHLQWGLRMVDMGVPKNMKFDLTASRYSEPKATFKSREHFNEEFCVGRHIKGHRPTFHKSYKGNVFYRCNLRDSAHGCPWSGILPLVCFLLVFPACVSSRVSSLLGSTWVALPVVAST